MTFPRRRILNFAGFLVCAGLMAYALYAQHQLMLEPCPLCVLQRFAVIGLGIVFLIAAIHNPAGGARRVYAGLLGLVTAFGVVVAGRHVWLQHLPSDEIPACGPGLDYMWENFPLADVVQHGLQGLGRVRDRRLDLSRPVDAGLGIDCGAGSRSRRHLEQRPEISSLGSLSSNAIAESLRGGIC